MSNSLPGRRAAARGNRWVRANVPAEVAEYYEAKARQYGGSVSAAVGPVLCAHARGEIVVQFVQRPGTDIRPR